MTGSLKRQREDVFGDVSFMDITPDDAYMTSETDMSDNSSSYSFMPMGEDENNNHHHHRVASPKTVLDAPRMFASGRNSPSTPKADKTSNDDEDNAEKRVTIWNWREKRKLSGNSAPFKKNLHEYLRKHPDWEEYRGQDKDMNGKKLTPKKRREQNNNNTSTPTTPVPVTPTKAPMPDSNPQQLPPVELSEPVAIYVLSEEDLANRRASEMAARRRLIEEEEAKMRRAEQEAERKRQAEAMELVRLREAQRAAAWRAAQAEAQRIQAEREVCRQKAEQQEQLKQRQLDEQTQQAAISHALSRFSSWKKVRLTCPAY